jgi:hypothetical protein
MKLNLKLEPNLKYGSSFSQKFRLLAAPDPEGCVKDYPANYRQN